MLEEKEKDTLLYTLVAGMTNVYMQTLKCESQEEFHTLYSGLGNMLNFTSKLTELILSSDESKELPESIQNILHEVIFNELKSLKGNVTLDITQAAMMKKYTDSLEGILAKMKQSDIVIEEPQIVTLT
jgi:hypothetical protein